MAAAGVTDVGDRAAGAARTRCPQDELVTALAPYPATPSCVWVQEEPANQGAWPFVALNLPTIDGRRLRRISRPAAATTAVGTHKVHEREQAEIVAAAFA